jgi:hypothetical protein
MKDIRPHAQFGRFGTFHVAHRKNSYVRERPLKATHNALIRSSWRIVPIHRMGRVFFVLHPPTPLDRITGSVSVSGPFLMNDNRFQILAKRKAKMRLKEDGDFYTVFVSAREVAEWNRRWPCSSLQGRQSFTFDRKGDLVDRYGKGDGPEAVALSHDAQEHAFARHDR